PQLVDGVPVGRVWSFRDVTERNRLDDLKDNLLTAVSHELRTPLTAIVGFSSTLERWGVQMSEQEVADVYKRLSNNARKLQLRVSPTISRNASSIRSSKGRPRRRSRPASGSGFRSLLASRRCTADVRGSKTGPVAALPSASS